jgi:ketosteroid isomerase-like protein
MNKRLTKEVPVSKRDELEKRIEKIENLEALKNLHRQYIYYVNSQQWDKVIDCFTEDAIADIGMHGSHKGTAELTELFTIKIARVNEKWNGGHFVTQPIVSVEGDTAKGCWMLYICVFDAETVSGQTLKWIQGRHDCEYIKRQGQWKISYIKYTRPWPTSPHS